MIRLINVLLLLVVSGWAYGYHRRLGKFALQKLLKRKYVVTYLMFLVRTVVSNGLPAEAKVFLDLVSIGS